MEIYPRFRDLLPPLMPNEMEQLEKSVLEEGIREPIKVWQNKIVDGHNRYELAQNYDLPFAVIDMHFESEDDACEWMIVNQLGRRNLEPNIKTLYIGQLYELQKKRNGEIQERNENGHFTERVTVTQSDVRTSEKIAQDFGVTEKTVRNAAKVNQAFEKAPDEIKEQFKSGNLSQKKLVESVKPTVNDILDDDKTDEHTRLCRDFGNRFQKVLRDFESLKDELSLAFGSKNFPLGEFAKNILTTNLSGQSNDAFFLKQVIKCPNCKGSKCEHCKQGYILEKDAATVLDVAAYRANGGMTL